MSRPSTPIPAISALKVSEEHGLKGPLRTRTRWLLLMLVTSCLMINWANILTFSFTVICMHPDHALHNHSEADAMVSERKDAHTLTNREKSIATVAVAVGALVTNIPLVCLINMFGARYIFTTVGLVGALATASIPHAMRLGFNWFVAARVVQGMAFAGDMATFGAFVSTWTYWKQTAFFTSTLCAYVQLAPVFTNPIAGMFCESSLGWPGVYYFHAAVTMFLFSLFFLAYRDNPEKHPFVGTIEQRKISAGKDPEEIKQRKNIPIWEILKSPSVWAVFVASLGNFAGINLILQFSPTYLNKVMGYTVASTGFLAALPPLLEAIMKEISGITNDKIRFVGETPKTKIYNTIAFFALATCLVILSFVPPGYPTLAMVLLTVGNCFLGFTTGGFYKSGSLIARQYAPFVLGQTSTGMTIMILVIPLLVNAITIDNTPVQWAWCFRIVAGFMILADIFYVLFASGEPCEWALCRDRVRPSIRPTGLYVPSKEPSEASGSRRPSEEFAAP